MARTFRLRHCPPLPGTARHFAFTHGSSYKTKEAAVLKLAKERAPDVMIQLCTTKWSNRSYFMWDQLGDARSVLEVAEDQVIVPILSPWYHPWHKRYGINVRRAKYYRQVAHRNIRRITKQMLNKPNDDYDNMSLPAWYEYFDRWSFT